MLQLQSCDCSCCLDNPIIYKRAFCWKDIVKESKDRISTNKHRQVFAKNRPRIICGHSDIAKNKDPKCKRLNSSAKVNGDFDVDKSIEPSTNGNNSKTGCSRINSDGMKYKCSFNDNKRNSRKNKYCIKYKSLLSGTLFMIISFMAIAAAAAATTTTATITDTTIGASVFFNNILGTDGPPILQWKDGGEFRSEVQNQN